MNSFLIFLIFSQAMVLTLADFSDLQRQYSAACKTELNANDEDFAILKSFEVPKNEIQSCLIDCLYIKLGIVADGKFNDQGHQNVVKAMAGNDPEKIAKMEEVYQTCSKGVPVDQKCPFGKAMRTCANAQFPNVVQSLNAAKKTT